VIGSILRIRYEIVEKLADGPIFATYLAKDRVQAREVTIRVFKQPFAAEPAFIDAVKQVVDKYSSCYANGIEAMIEVDDDDGVPFLISENSKGVALSERIHKLAPFSVSVVVSTAISICEGLASLHQRGVVHGDVSPDTLVALPDGQCRLQIPGIWEAYSSSQTAGIVALPGMAAYLAPEISAGGMPSPQGDVYAVGILMFQLVSGRLPYNADNPVAMAMKHATAPVPSVKVYSNAVPVAFDEIVKRAMAKNPAERYQDAGELLSDLRKLQDSLRFGRSLELPNKKPSSSDKQPVAPKMSAIREPESDDKKRKKKEPKVRDVPLWLSLTAVVFGLGVVGLIIAWVVFNISQPSLVVVPNIKGSKEIDARKNLEALKLKMVIKREETSETYPPRTILDVNPSPGKKVYEGAEVAVVVSSGSKFVEVPDLKGDTVDTAKQKLENVNLTLDSLMGKKADRRINAGLIISQDPEARKKVDRFTAVRVTLSSGRSGDSGSDESVDEKEYVYNLTIKLSNLESAVNLRVAITDSHGTRTVFQQGKDPDDVVEISTRGYGKSAQFQIYYDEVLVKTIDKKADGSSDVGDNRGDNR